MYRVFQSPSTMLNVYTSMYFTKAILFPVTLLSSIVIFSGAPITPASISSCSTCNWSCRRDNQKLFQGSLSSFGENNTYLVCPGRGSQEPLQPLNTIYAEKNVSFQQVLLFSPLKIVFYIRVEDLYFIFGAVPHLMYYGSVWIICSFMFVYVRLKFKRTNSNNLIF